jgi:5'-3' exonuclease
VNPYVVVIDYSHAFWRCYSIALTAPAHFDLIDTTVYHFQGVLKTLASSLSKMGVTEYDTVFAEDRIPLRKLNLLPSYRGNRTSNKDFEKRKVKEELRNRGVKGHWVYSQGNEADDVMATLVRLSSANKIFSIIVTADKDLWQLINESTSVFNPKTKEIVTLEDVEKSFSVKPSHIALHKAIWGDAGDCIPNTCPRTQKALLPILRQSDGTYSHFSMLVEEQWDSLSRTCKQRLIEGHAQCEINWNLVKLDNQCPLTWE